MKAKGRVGLYAGIRVDYVYEQQKEEVNVVRWKGGGGGGGEARAGQ